MFELILKYTMPVIFSPIGFMTLCLLLYVLVCALPKRIVRIILWTTVISFMCLLLYGSYLAGIELCKCFELFGW